MGSIYIMYMIKCSDENVKDRYVGFTQDFKGRKHTHKKRCINETGKRYNNRLYRYIRGNGGWSNFEMKSIEAFICHTKLEAIRREYQLQCEYQSQLNLEMWDLNWQDMLLS